MSGRIDKEDIFFYICVPVYKTEKYLQDCIDSVLSQTYKNFCLILVDDGSPDKSGQICDSYAERNSNIKVIHQKNSGLISARRVAVSYILELDNFSHNYNSYALFLDSDDSFKENALLVLADRIAETDCDLVFFGMDRVRDGAIVEPFNYKRALNGLVTEKRRLYNIVFTDQQYNVLWRKAIKVALLENKDYSEYYHIQRGEDLLQSIDIYKKANSTLFLPQSLYNYTINPDSITQTIKSVNYKPDSTVRGKVLEFIEEEQVQTEEDIKKYKNICRLFLIDEIYMISGFKITLKEKIKIFNDILDDKYYKKLIYDKNCKQKTLIFLGKRKYRLSILFCKLNHNVRRIKNKLSRMFKR